MPDYQSTKPVSKQKMNVSYLSKDFDSIKKDLIDYLQRYYPDEYQDFNEASGGMAMGKVKTAAPSKDGVAVKGKTKGTMIKMCGGGMAKKGK